MSFFFVFITCKKLFLLCNNYIVLLLFYFAFFLYGVNIVSLKYVIKSHYLCRI